MTVVPNIPLAEFQFIYQAPKQLEPSLLTASLWHGVFGNALRELVCQVPQSECKSCMFLQQCDYPFLFEGVKSLDEKKSPMHNNIPVPHIFKPAIVQCHDTTGVQRVDVSMVLIGKASEHLPVVIKAMILAGKKGIAKNRIPLQLKQVRQKNQHFSQLIYSEDLLYTALSAQSPVLPEMPSSVQLIFDTPYRSGNNKFDGAFFLMQIIRRVSSLQSCYTTQFLDADFEKLKILTNKAELKPTIEYQAELRYSARHKQTLSSGGFMGKITIAMKGVEALWPYIYLGQWIHVGKNASFGYGCYQLLSVIERKQ